MFQVFDHLEDEHSMDGDNEEKLRINCFSPATGYGLCTTAQDEMYFNISKLKDTMNEHMEAVAKDNVNELVPPSCTSLSSLSYSLMW